MTTQTAEKPRRRRKQPPIGEQLALFAPRPDDLPPPMKVEPVIKWAGGKRWILPHIGAGIWSRLSKTRGRYLEPFFGGGAVGLWLGLGARMRVADACPELVMLYQQLRNDAGAVAWALSGMTVDGVDEAAYYRVRDLDPESPTVAAARVIYLTRLGFNGLWRVNRKGGHNVPYGDNFRPSMIGRKGRDAIGSLFPNKEKLAAVGKALAGAQINCDDFEAEIDRAVDGDVVYADPPYAGASFTAYTAEGFTDDDQRRLGEALHRAAQRGVTVLASNRDNDLTREIYSWADIVPVAESRVINSDVTGRKRVGCIIATNAIGLIDGAR